MKDKATHDSRSLPGFTLKQSIAIRSLADGMTQADAGRAAGYSAPHVEVCRLMQKDAARDAVRKLQEGQKVLLGQKALSKLNRLLDQDDVPHAVQRNLIRDALEVAGHIKQKETQQDKGQGTDNINDMSYEQIAKVMQAATSRMAQIEQELQDISPDRPPAMIECSAQPIEDNDK